MSLTNNRRGILLMFLAMQIVPASDAIAKVLTNDYGLSPEQTAWFRLSVGAACLLPFAGWLERHGFAGKRSKNPFRALVWLFVILRPHWWRGLFWAATTFFYFAAIRDNPLPNALALAFVSPLFVAAAAPFLLGEHFSRLRVSAIAAGFVGVLIVLRPGGGFSPTLALALVAGIAYGSYLMATRRARDNGGTGIQTALTAMLTGAILSAPLVIADWQVPSAPAAALIAAMGGLSALGHYLLARACEYAAASSLAPLIYTEMLGTMLLSFWLFGQIPDLVAAVGIVIIIAAGLVVMLYDSKTAA